MSDAHALGLVQMSLWSALQIAAPVMLACLAVGVVVSVFQSATQIQEQSLVFVPKVIAMFCCLLLAGGWMMAHAVFLARTLFESLPTLAR